MRIGDFLNFSCAVGKAETSTSMKIAALRISFGLYSKSSSEVRVSGPSAAAHLYIFQENAPLRVAGLRHNQPDEYNPFMKHRYFDPGRGLGILFALCTFMAQLPLWAHSRSDSASTLTQRVLTQHDQLWTKTRKYRLQYREHKNYGSRGDQDYTRQSRSMVSSKEQEMAQAYAQWGAETGRLTTSLTSSEVHAKAQASWSPEWLRAQLPSDRRLLQAAEQSGLQALYLGFYDPDTVTASPEDLFATPRQEFISSAAKLSSVDLLPSATEAFQRKMTLLLGKELPASVIERAQADYPVNISSAPQYDRILISTLFIRRDFSGYLLSRALLQHASRGTKVHIMYSKAALRGLALKNRSSGRKDQQLIDELQAHPNVTVIASAYRDTGGNSFESYHRAHHAKIFMVIPKKGMFSQARMIIGGRNLSDASLFFTPPDHSRYPGLVQYDHKYHPAVDLEVEVQSEALARDVSTQFYNYWRMHRLGVILPSSVARVPAPELTSQIKRSFSLQSSLGSARHFFHVPYMPPLQGGDLSDFFVDLIDSAKSRIDILTPYYHMNDKILGAIRRADQRGLQIHVVTNTDLTKDAFLPENTTQANLEGIEQTVAYARIHGWKYSHIMVHSKAMIIDNSLVYIGSANMNRRSFSHDIENGLLLHSPKLAKELRGVIQSYYLPHTERIGRARLTELQRRPLNKFVVSILPGLF